ncbi:MULTISPECIES: hypothetical protein [Streptomyces]|uniref:hypothetical protein n=1 Tax=Streptomyces TaxID=1883 RepID=UPI0022AA61AB|nr:hypothetical protein [Streptomyces sp. HB2AG]MCZ2525995.1 hypothetical protein [Streptomyces sp. HB2AG]
MGFFDGIDQLDLFLTRCRALSLGSVPVCLAGMVFFIKEEGWHFSFLVCCILPLVAAYLGFRGKQEIRAGMSATAAALAGATLPLTFALAAVEGF